MPVRLNRGPAAGSPGRLAAPWSLFQSHRRGLLAPSGPSVAPPTELLAEAPGPGPRHGTWPVQYTLSWSESERALSYTGAAHRRRALGPFAGARCGAGGAYVDPALVRTVLCRVQHGPILAAIARIPHVILTCVLVPLRCLVVLDASDVPAVVEDVGDPSYLPLVQVRAALLGL